MNNIICYHHNKDMDGYASGAIVKHRYPNAELRGWDYKDPVPSFEDLHGKDVILIDITFPLVELNKLSYIAENLTVIDHHISFKKQVDVLEEGVLNFTYIYQDNKAACEIGWEYLFPDVPVPHGVTLIGRYDTWRQNEGDWEGETLPFKYRMYGICNSAHNFPKILFDTNEYSETYILFGITVGKSIMEYQNIMDESIAEKNAFVTTAYGYKALCINYYPFSSETLKSIFNPEIHDIMVGFVWTGKKWGVSLRSIDTNPDVSVIAKERGGGGHRNAAGFEVGFFEDIFK